MRRFILPALLACALAPASAQAAGVTTHAFMAETAISSVRSPQLGTLLHDHRSALLSGAAYPDGGYASSSYPGGNYGEITHWERFIDAYVDHLRARTDCAPLLDPDGPCADIVAHLMGAAAHGMSDETWDWNFEPSMADHGESPVHPVYSSGAPGAAELATVPPGSLINTPEFAMDMVALVEHGRATAFPTYVPPVDDLLDVYHRIGRDDITKDGILAGQSLITAAQAGERAAIASEYPRVKLTMPKSAAAYMTAPGGVDWSAHAIAGYYDALWARLGGEKPVPKVVQFAPARGQTGVRADWLPAKTSPGPMGGGSDRRILAAFSKAIRPESITPQTFQLLDAWHRPVKPLDGFPRIGPYGGADGEHNMLFYPGTDLKKCSRYTALLTTGITDWDGKHLSRPYQWSFTTAC